MDVSGKEPTIEAIKGCFPVRRFFYVGIRTECSGHENRRSLTRIQHTYVNVRKKTYHWKTTLFSNRNPSRGMRSLLKALKYMFFPCTEDIVDGCNVEFHSITGIICAVSSTDKIMREHCFPQGWLLKHPWPG